MASEDFGARLKSLITRFGFRPDEVSVSSRFGVGTISFKNQKGKATELVSKLRAAMKQMGVPEAAITAREVQYPADADGPAEHWGVVNVDFNKMPHSRPGEKDMMASEKESFQKEYILWALPKGETDRLHERPIVEGIQTPQQMDDAKRKAAAQGWHGFRVQILDMSKPFRWMSRPGAKATFKVEDRFYFGKGRKERFELSFNRAEVERAKSELRSLVDVHRRLASKSEGVKSAKHGVIADVLARLINQGPEVLAAIGFRKASYWNARAMELANASSSGYGPILKTLISEAEREYRSH